jgi:RNA polymerase sigma factor (TIGR02999 family)
MGTEGHVAGLLDDIQAGRKGAADELFQWLYPELRRLAASRMRREAAGHSWQPTLLVNELYLELLKNKALDGSNFTPDQRSAFLGLAGFLMNRLLILHSRPMREKVTEVGEGAIAELAAATPTPESLQMVEDLLSRIEAVDPQLRTVVEMRVFEGKSHDEIAALMGCSTRSVARYWSFARRWLEKELAPAP